MPAASSPLIRRATVSLAVAATLLTLAACVEAPGEPDRPDTSATPTDTPTATPEPTTTDTPDALDIACAELVDLDTMYAFDPNFALLGTWDPEPRTLAADDVAAGGVACRWVRESGGSTIDLSVAAYSDAQLDDLKNAAFGDSEMVPTYGEEAYFEVDGRVGTAIVFQGRYRLVASSEAFFEPGEPTGIIEAALAALAAL